MLSSTKIQCAAMPAQKPPRVWQPMALPMSSLQPSESIIEVCVLK